uniref:Uncharacterized protein n=1 Tax=Chenopodium quinoa TaxID=63459 RepID=A0A803LG65_CHEQI
MISTKKLIKMARKWQKIAAASRKRISRSRYVADKGHFVVYTSDKKRFMIPLDYLESEIFRELFRIAEEEFGVASSGPIMLPCDSNLMEYAISMIQRHVAEDLEKALIMLVMVHGTNSNKDNNNCLVNPREYHFEKTNFR